MNDSIAPAAFNALKTAFKLLVADLGGIEAAATCTRVGKSQIAEYGSVNAPERHVPADVLLALETVAGAPHVTAALARAQGYKLVRLESAARPGDLAVVTSRLAADVTHFYGDFSAAIAGGALTEGERTVLLADIDHVRATAEEAATALRGRRP
jgi:hypothetical protein